ncbi:MAG: glycine/D-amino acid oxidase [Candidatus Nomurabacteria bacterium]|jgi:glycine/D-amino acid oxidase-like deaminating enzyme|nr:glycine/D-amino acid oxidase [Candidatus Nomurabacteria bacterium]
MKNISYWLDIPYTPRPSLSADITTDVIIIGGGITGVSTAYHCAKQGLRTVLIEKDTIASGSAGKNGGMVVEGFSMDFATAVEKLGLETARDSWNNTIEARKMVQSLIAEYKIDCDFSQPGSLYSVETSEGATWVRKEAATRKSADIECELIEQGIQLKHSPFLLHLFNPMDCMLHPVKFVRGLAEVAERYGAVIFENTKAISFTEHEVMTSVGIISANKVVLCLETSDPSITPAQGRIAREQAIVTEPLTDEQMANIDWPKGGMLWTEEPDYINIRKIGNRLFTSYSISLQPTSDERDQNREQLLEFIHHCLPGLKTQDIAISHCWEGLLFYTERSRPYIGKRNGLYQVYGQGGNGLTHGVLAGKILADSFIGTPIPDLYNLKP